MAISHDSVGRYERRPVAHHGVVRAVWVREAGALAGSPAFVVARTFSSVVLHLADGGDDVEVRRAGDLSTATLSPHALGFDAHPWASEAAIVGLERTVRSVAVRRPLDEIIGTVLARTDAPSADTDVQFMTTELERTPTRRTMTVLAEQASASPRTLRRRFLSTLGMSVDRYRVVARAARARELLVATATPLAELAWQLGYADQSHLHRDLIELSGYTPTEWRRRRTTWQVTGTGSEAAIVSE